MFQKFNDEMIVRYLSNSISEKDKKIIEDHIKNDRDFAEQVAMMRNVWETKPQEIHIQDLDMKWLQMRNRIEGELREEQRDAELNRKWGRRSVGPAWLFGIRLVPVAAIVLLLLAGSFYVVKQMAKTKITYADLTTQMETIEIAHKERAKIELADGTRIVLDAGSKLTYPAQFSNHQREVTLEGEGFFEVEKDKSRPFVVHAKNAEIKVLGTKFNVRAWKESETITVAVKEGLVSLAQAHDSSDKQVLIGGGKQSQLTKDGKLAEVNRTDIDRHIAWMDNEIRMKNVKLKEVLAQLTRWYDFEFHVQDSHLLETPITVHIRKTNIDDVFELIGMITHTKVERDSNVIHMLSE